MNQRKDELKRLQELLKGRREEYKIFGVTSEDLEYDNNLKEKIRNLLTPPIKSDGR